MISKTIGEKGVHNIFRHNHLVLRSSGCLALGPESPKNVVEPSPINPEEPGKHSEMGIWLGQSYMDTLIL